MWNTYYQPTTLAEALALLAEHGSTARIVAGGSDLTVELQRGFRPTSTLIDITRLDELRSVRLDGEMIVIGALATHNDIVASPLCVERALPLAQACWEVGAPQIRARATVAGNLVTASPANDTITPLIALGAEVVLVSIDGERVLPLHAFYIGVRRTALRPGELLRAIRFPALAAHQRGVFLKLGLRRAQAISVVNVAVIVDHGAPDANGTEHGARGRLESARIALGCVAPTIVRATAAEAFLAGRVLDAESAAAAAGLAVEAAAPIDDLRGSAAYRRAAVAALVSDALGQLADGRERAAWPARPVLLAHHGGQPAEPHGQGAPVGSLVTHFSSPLQTVATTINGEPATLAPHKTLLDALREDAGLTGTKEGCGEGECGACTVWLNGAAVMSCLVPAAQAHGGQVVTIEGLAATAAAGALHPLQEAFIAHGAVQCGYCIPGMLMAGAKLLQEQAQPDDETIRTALSGNICRCTGYRKIFAAVEAAARPPVVND